MTLYRSIRAVARASDDSTIDWDASAAAAKEAIDPGSIDLDPGELDGYRQDVRDARRIVSEAAGFEFDLPSTIEIQHRHHWIDANVDTFSRLLSPLESQRVPMQGLASTINTGTMGIMLAFLGRNVLGQYDPLLLADAPSDEHALYFVRPNILHVAEVLDVDSDRFRRWIAVHEVTHAAEFDAAPWLPEYLERNMVEGLEHLATGSFDRDVFIELDAVMTVVEGYAELLMDHAFDDEYADLRQKLDAHRQGRGPLQRFLRRALGLGLKRRQYERGRAFFERVVELRDVETANHVWDRPERLPTPEELDEPRQWIDRIERESVSFEWSH